MDAHKFFGPGTGMGQTTDGQGGGVAGKKPTRSQHGLGLLRDLGLEFAVFKNGLDDQVAALEVSGSCRGMNERQQRLLLVCGHAALVHALLGEFLAVGFAFFRSFQIHVFQHRGNAPAGLRVGDARAHHARAQNADLLRFVTWHSLGTALTTLDAVHVEEKRVDHVARHLTGHQTRQVTAFDAHGGVEVHHRAFDHGSQCCFGCRVQAACFLLEHCRGHAQHARHFRVAGRAAGHLVVLAVPHMLGRFRLALH